ncbi:MAG: alpha/beta fold hydrolase [Acidimicrobiia bacterium]|jgi:3-oxoadipate enol-lactonase
MFHRVGTRLVHSVSFGSGPGTFVGIAGSFASWEIWAPTFEQLSRRWRVVGFDHDGVGQTKVPLEEITRERHLETLFSVLDAQRIDRCVIAGDSNNAALALEAVLHEPDRFAGVVIVNGHAWGFDTPDARRFARGLRERFDQTVELFVQVVFPEADSDHLKAWLADIITRTGPEAAARIVEIYYGLDLRPRLGDIAVPATIVHGVLDALSPSALDDAKELASLLRADLHLLDGAGHLPLLSRPDEVARLLDSFLEEHSP